MFELSIALKYLIPRKKQLSMSLIAIMSVTVISLVIWLVLVFLSVTEGMERNWLDKLTCLNAPMRITPTEAYFSSYYYAVDAHSAASHYSYKNIAQKRAALASDPYSSLEDAQLPDRFPSPHRSENGELKDLVKEVYSSLEEMKQKDATLVFQDFEISGALMRLQLLRPNASPAKAENRQSFLTQVSHLASLPDRSRSFANMVLPPTEKDLDHLFYLAAHTTENAREDSPSLMHHAALEKVNARVRELIASVKIEQLQNNGSLWKLDASWLPENTLFQCKQTQEDIPTHLILCKEKQRSKPEMTKIWRTKEGLIFEGKNRKKQTLPLTLPLFVEGPLNFEVQQTLIPPQIQHLNDIHFQVQTPVQKVSLSGVIPWENLCISRAVFNTHFSMGSTFWPLYSKEGEKKIALPITKEKETGVLLAKNYRDNGVLVGDRGYLSYNIATMSSVQEQRLPIFVAGFYDPGIMSVGNRCILVPAFITQTINASSSAFNLDKTQANGIAIWFDDLSKADLLKKELQQKLSQKNLSAYWKVTTFKEYDFAKDLLQQFQSDKYLFSLIAAIILLVASCNIISLLTLLVNDKKREIGILQAMGASTKSIASIFGICGITMGIMSALIGSCAALFTLHHIDGIVNALSFLQGHEAFNAAFFGESLPNQLSKSALQFVLILTPILSLLAACLPALKACRLRPSEILRAE